MNCKGECKGNSLHTLLLFLFQCFSIIVLRIDASGWGVNFDALFQKVCMISCFPGL